MYYESVFPRQAYCCWMKGLLEFERQDWKNARDNFSKSKFVLSNEFVTIY